jgi:hypothetical protein
MEAAGRLAQGQRAIEGEELLAPLRSRSGATTVTLPTSASAPARA